MTPNKPPSPKRSPDLRLLFLFFVVRALILETGTSLTSSPGSGVPSRLASGEGDGVSTKTLAIRRRNADMLAEPEGEYRGVRCLVVENKKCFECNKLLMVLVFHMREHPRACRALPSFADPDFVQNTKSQPENRRFSSSSTPCHALTSLLDYKPTMSRDVSKPTSESVQTTPLGIEYVQYSLQKESQYLAQIRELIAKDLSEPYSIYVYHYFLYQWAELCFMAIDTTNNHQLAGVVICKLEPHRGEPMRGYIAMLATKEEHRGKGIATTLVSKAIDLMIAKDADEIALETEESNTAAMKLYERLGFLRSKKLHRYYLNGSSAYRLLLYLKEGVGSIPTDYDPYGDLPPSAAGSPDPQDLLSRGIV